MANYVYAVKTGKLNGLDEFERNIVNFERNRLDQNIDWYSIKQMDMEQVEKELRRLFPVGWTSLLFSVKLSAKVFKNHNEKTYREFYENLSEEEIDYMNESLRLGIEGAMRIAG